MALNHLSATQVAQYQETGVVFPLNILTPDEALGLLPAFERLQARMGHWTDRPQLLKANLVSRWVYELVTRPALLDAVETLIGPDILCWGAAFFAKPAYSGGYVGWHQDITYWGLAPQSGVVTAWLGLSDAQIDNGCMRVIAGTHKNALRHHNTNSNTANMLISGQEVALGDDESDRIINVQLEPGQASIHHCLALHGSNPNSSSRPRIGLSINYVNADVVQKNNAGIDSALPVRGDTSRSQFINERAPDGEFDLRSIDEWKQRIGMPSGLGATAEHIDLTRDLNVS